MPLLMLAAMLAFASAAHAADTVWLCNPSVADDPCQPSLDTTVLSPTGAVLRVMSISPPRSPKVDCFYVYPTVSDQPTANANLDIDPEQQSIALYEAARYSEVCRVFAPMYRQVTLQGLRDHTGDLAHGYVDVRDAWHEYLRSENDGRGVVLLGHSQGSYMLRRLIAEEIDPDPAMRSKLVSAILLGGNVTGSEFKNVAPCASRRQLGCVVAFSTFDAPVPKDARYGRDEHGAQVLCTNPAALGSGSAPLRTVVPTTPFAPGTTIGASIRDIGLVFPAVSTPWIYVQGAYDGECSSADDANVLQITAETGAPRLTPAPDANWGLHLVDGNIALGNLTSLVRSQAKTFVRKRHCRYRKSSGWSSCRTSSGS
ncbi:MAG TPA: DUF3089 domain-containing protein [Candidatus Binatia bacterium]|nr:DUF3089 domain-containing protein [Candidatus Binatia bacterium]